jgi:O-antigen ligase
MRVSARTVAALGAIGIALGNIGRIPGVALGGRTSPLVAADLVVALVWVVLLFAVTSGRARVVVDDVMSATLAFIAAAVISTCLAFTRYNLGIADGAGVAAFLARWVAYFGWYPFVVWCLTPEESRDAWAYVERALLVFAVAGILQSAFLPGFAQMIHDGGDLPTWDVQGRRLVSSMLDPNFAGALVVIALIARLARIAEGLHESGIALAALGAAVLLTVSRSSILALVVGLVVIAVARGLRLRLFRILALGTVLVLPFLSLLIAFAGSFNKLHYDSSAAQRLVPWIRAGRLLNEHPWFGIGFNAIKQAQESHGWRTIGGADVSFDGGLIFVAAMTGIVGLFFYLRMLVRVGRGARRAWRDASLPPADRAHATATAAATAAIVVHSFFVNSLLLPFVMQILWVMWGRLAHIRAARRARLGLAVALPLAFAASCDPCAGTINCSSASRATLTGTIVDHFTGVGVAGARIDLRVTDANGAITDAHATTDAQGVWQASALAATGSATAQVTVTSPRQASYTVAKIALRASTTSGDAMVVGLWSDIPFVRHLATVVHGGAPLTDAQVHFSRTSGPAIITGQSDGTTNGVGIFELDFAAQDVGQLVGELIITHPSLDRPIVVHGYAIPLDYRFGIPAPNGTIGRGKLLAYGGELLFRGTDAKAPGVSVDFQRTGGVATKADHVATVTGPTGFFLLDLAPANDDAVGDVIGDLTFRPPNASPTTYANVHLATYDSAFTRSMGLWAYGERWAWALELWRNSDLKPAPGIRVQFLRTGGLAITPSTIDGLLTDAGGRFELRAAVHDTGVVEGQLIVFPSGGPNRVISGVRLRTNADDQLHFGGVVSFGPALHFVGEVLTPDGTPVVGARVQWTQTSGIPATPATLDVVTDVNGRFPLELVPSADGGVIGRVRVRPPPPWPATAEYVFENLRLDSFESANLKLAVTYRIPRP